jgi:hypothetical protein
VGKRDENAARLGPVFDFGGKSESSAYSPIKSSSLSLSLLLLPPTIRPESRDKYTRSKSPNIFNRKTIEVSTPAVTKAPVAPGQKQQRARTASMPGENRKVSRQQAAGALSRNWKAITHSLSASRQSFHRSMMSGSSRSS